MITLTEKAVEKLKEFCESEAIDYQSIRIKVIGGGCAGMTNDMSFSNTINETDEVFESLGFKVIIDPLSLQYLDGTEIDWVDQGYTSGFKFNNPNVKGTCGCGHSSSY